MKHTFFFIIIVLLAALAGCTNKPFTMEDSGRTVELDLDSPFMVELKGNASTGYSWEILEMDTTVVRQIGKQGYMPSGDKIGSGGTYTFWFKTVDFGETELVIGYVRRFESDEPPAKIFRMKIISGMMGRITGE
ncbi:MAG: protease inhibitor I42 family protein [Chlorobi bacterium]|nr:protease inhibitor I42 family protein [Chlorobiota bacterium]